MIKSITAILLSAALLLGLGLFEWFYVEEEFRGFSQEIQTLYQKTEENTANGEDAKAVQTAWGERKTRLHVWIPHNDINRVDDYLSESVRLIEEQNYSLALAKLEILLHLSECLPAAYRPAAENVF